MKAFIIKKILVLILMLPILCLAEIKDSIYHEMDRSYYLHLPKDYSEDTSNQLAKNQLYITKTRKVYFID